MIREGLSFDDVLLVPHHSEIESRSQIDISVKWKGLYFAHPLIPSNMQSVIGQEMAIQIIKSGGLAIMHRFMDSQEQLQIAEYIIDNYGNEQFAVSVGVQPADREMIEKFYHVGIRIICIDIAHGDSKQCVDMVSWIRSNKPDVFIIAGCIATGEGAKRLWMAGADAVRVGIGNGSLCTTRIQTGNGVPQLTALMDVAEARKTITTPWKHTRYKSNEDAYGEVVINPPVCSKSTYIIADGGCKSAGDLVKSLCFADMVMSGNLFAGCEESPGKKLMIDGVTYKEYVGSSTHKTTHVEGVSALVLCKPYYKDILTKLLEGLRSGCSYQGAHNLEELRDNPVFIRMTNAGLVESHPHDVILK